MFYNVLNYYFYNIINFKKILLKKHVWSFCMGSLGPMTWIKWKSEGKEYLPGCVIKEPALYTVRVIRNELQRSPFVTVTGQTLGGEISLSIGIGFQTFDRYGLDM